MMSLQLLHANGLLSQYSVVSSFRQRKWKKKDKIMCLQTQTQARTSRTQRILESISLSDEVGGAGGACSYEALKRLDKLWSSLCSSKEASQEPPQVVSSYPGVSSRFNLAGKKVQKFDVVVCGGTLGIFIATALSVKGLRVGVVERNIIKGREQEWNISRKELLEFVEVGILKEEEIEQAAAMEFNPNRCGFEGKDDIWVEDILNLGVSPVKLIEIIKKRFISLGGVILEGYSVSTISIYEDAENISCISYYEFDMFLSQVLQLAEGEMLSSRLIIDAMGNFSPVVKQIRKGRKPDGFCLAVGSCARGFKNNSTSDVIYCSSVVKKIGNSKVQCFWEAFPAASGPKDRTTYLFTYVDPVPEAPKLEEILEEYWKLMPNYQDVLLDDLEILRVIFGIFPTYKDSPLPAAFNRVLQFGDASGIQSPVSFGGFGSLTRHLGRLSTGIYEAISGDFLDAYHLSLLNPYMPNLSASRLFLRAMTAKQNSDIPPNFINELLFINFLSMKRLGDPVLKPFLQDVVQFGPLAKTLGMVMLTKPLIIPTIFKQVGLPELLNWSGHFFMLGYYTLLSTFVDPVIRPFLNSAPSKTKYVWKRHLESWKYGAGLDFKLEYFKMAKKLKGGKEYMALINNNRSTEKVRH